MTDLTRHIDFLLLSHDCVIVPGLGAVLARTVSSRIDSESGLITPPMRRFAFNGSLTQSDGLLAWSVSRANGISIDEAARAVDGAVATMQRSLSAGRTVSLGRAGSLVPGSDGATPSFVMAPDAPAMLSPAYSWLPTLEVKPVKEIVKALDREAASTGHLHRVWRAVRVAAIVIGLIAVGVLIKIPVQLENANFASLVFTSASKPTAPSIVEIPGRSKATVRLELSKHADACETVDTAEYRAMRRMAAMHKYQPAEQSASTGRYCLVVASVGSIADAQKFIARNTDLDLDILEKDGRVRIFAATGDTSAEVQSQAKSLADRFPDAWVCRR